MATTIERIPTGIPGLDKFMEGGFPANSVALLAGNSGTGKTIATIQWCAALLKLGHKPIFFCFEQKPEDIKKQAELFGYDLTEVTFISAKDMKYDTMLGKKPKDPTDLISLMIEKIKSKFVVIDSMSSLLIDDGLRARLLIKQLIDGLKKKEVTALVTSEISEAEKTEGTVAFLVDVHLFLAARPLEMFLKEPCR